KLLGNRLPLAAGAKAIEDATQHDSVGRGRTSTFVVPSNGWSRKQPLDAVPQLVRDIGEFACHIRHAYAESSNNSRSQFAAARSERTCSSRYRTPPARAALITSSWSRRGSRSRC